MTAGKGLPRYRALVLAGQRDGDPLAEHSPQGHKCLLPVAGRPMIERVVAALLAARTVEAIAVSIDRPGVLEAVPGFGELLARGRITLLESKASPALSVLHALEGGAEQPLPLLVTTADHALLSPGIVQSFCRAADARGADVAAGLVSRRTIEAQVPVTKRTYLRFRDGGYSGANLFAFRTAAGLRAAEFWRRVERDRKSPWRIARAFGPYLLAAYFLRLYSLEQVMVRASRRLDCDAAAIVLEVAEAAIDVDKLADLELVEQLLARRGA
jgi:GTP:adenosylcobinamide-phosphate guanylyltransferase